MALDRKSGNRVPRMNDHADVLERQDETLRIIDDATFDQIQSRIVQSRRGGDNRPAPRGVQIFTGLVYCECGAKCHRLTSENAKGKYSYYMCSRKLRYDKCDYDGHRVREDMLLKSVQQEFADLFKNRESLISRLLDMAKQAAKSNRGEADRIRAELKDIDGEQARLLELLMDRALSDVTKQTINRKMAETETRRGVLTAALGNLHDQANADLDGLAEIVRDVFCEAERSLESADTPELLNRLIDDYFGPITINADGSIQQKETPPAATEGVPGTQVMTGEGQLLECIAGGRYVPKQIMRTMFRLRQAA